MISWRFCHIFSYMWRLWLAGERLHIYVRVSLCLLYAGVKTVSASLRERTLLEYTTSVDLGMWMSGHAPFSLVDFRKGDLSRTVYRWVLEGKVFSFRLKAPSDRCFFVFSMGFSSYSSHLLIFVWSFCQLCPCSCVVVAAFLQLNYLILLQPFCPCVCGNLTVLCFIIPSFLHSVAFVQSCIIWSVRQLCGPEEGSCVRRMDSEVVVSMTALRKATESEGDSVNRIHSILDLKLGLKATGAVLCRSVCRC